MLTHTWKCGYVPNVFGGRRAKLERKTHAFVYIISKTMVVVVPFEGVRPDDRPKSVTEENSACKGSRR